MKFTTKITILSFIFFITALSSIHANNLAQIERSFLDRQKNFLKRMESFQKSLWQEFDDQTNTTEKSKLSTQTRANIVILPKIKIEELVQNNPEVKNLKLEILDLTSDKVQIQFHPKNKVAIITFPYMQGEASLKIYQYGYQIDVKKEIIEEKKDKEGKVLSKSSYNAFNSQFTSFPFSINIESIKNSTPIMTGNKLTLKLESFKIPKTSVDIPVKKIESPKINKKNITKINKKPTTKTQPKKRNKK